MSRLQDKEEYKKFITRTVYPIVDPLETRGWLFGGNGKHINSIAYPICQEDIEDLRAGKYDGHRYIIGNYPPQTVLIKHPFRPYELIPSYTSEHQIITNHLADLERIFKALGTRECEVTAKITKQETVTIDGKGKMTIKAADVKGDFKETKDNSMESEYKMVIKREPGDNNGYELAYGIAEEDGLLEVPKIADILKCFNSKIKGKDKLYQLSEVLTESYHKTIDAVIKINASGAFKFKGELNTDYVCRRTIRIDKTIYFE